MHAVIAGQRGQALIAVMVVMVVLFALAGAVALAASTLLTGRGQSVSTNNDFQVRSAVNDTVAQVAGSTSQCSAPLLTSPSPTPPSATTATPLQLALPGGARPQALCVRQDAVVAGSLQRYDGAGSCASIPLGQRLGHVAALFDARSTGNGWAYLGGQAQTSCVGGLPDLDSVPATCFQTVAKAPVVQVALSCPFTTRTNVFLNLFVPGAGPNAVFAAAQDPSASASTLGSLYLLASGTGLPSPDYEESVLYVSSRGSPNRLLYEARLP